MKVYKISAETEKYIKEYITELCEADSWQQYLSNMDKGIHNIVYLGKIVDQPAEYDEEGEEISPATYFEGYHADIMSENEIEFPEEITQHNPKNPKHRFA